MKSLLLPILIVLLIIATNAFCQTPEELEEVVNLHSQEEFIKAGKDTPKELESMGFTKNNLIGYYYLGNTEYYAFSDWRTKERGDAITWVVIDGEVKNYFKDEEGEKEGREI